MGMETLNSAARAAGFAMATPDEPVIPAGKGLGSELQSWQPGEPVLVEVSSPPKPASGTDWVRGLFSIFGRGALA